MPYNLVQAVQALAGSDIVRVWLNIIGALLSLFTFGGVLYRMGKHEAEVKARQREFEATVDAKIASQDLKLNGFGERVNDLKNDQSLLEGVVSTLESLAQRTLGSQEATAGRLVDYQREVGEGRAEIRAMSQQITTEFKQIPVAIAEIKTEVAVGKRGT